jgi:acyl-lipid omega-6 desaturase (Delta-12 desaturase)
MSETMDSKDQLREYARPRLWRSLLDLATSVVPYVGLTAFMYVSLGWNIWLTLGLAVPTAAFLLRTFIVFHDCGHGSFFASKAANRWLGRFTALLVWQPFENWRFDHAVHHGTAGDLDRRGQGDVPTLTIEEYYGRPWTQRLGYRLFRHPLVMFGLGPLFARVIRPRLVPRSARPRIRRSVIGTDVALMVLIGLLCWLVGWREYMLVQLPMVLLAGGAGIWLFYVQHQFEDTYWQSADDWSYADAALRGSSYLKLPKLLRFFTGNIGLHHVHHLSARVPNYNLQRAHDENPIFHDVPTLSLSDGLRSVRLKLWDADRGRLVTFAAATDEARRWPTATISSSPTP